MTAPATNQAPRPIPVILSTDIGDDIDDTWALAFLLRCPELEPRLIVGDHGKSQYRAKLIAKFLETAGRTDIPVGIGPDVNQHGEGAQAAWAKDYDLAKYPGRVLTNGVQAIVDTIMQSSERVTLVAIGPMPNVRLALEREPRIAGRARLVGMHGSVRRGYGNGSKPEAEYNVKEDARSCQAGFAARWPITITPLDTCGLVDLRGAEFERISKASGALIAALRENDRTWRESQRRNGGQPPGPERSSTLFDTVAVYLAFREEGLRIEELGLRVTEDGFTRLDPAARTVRVATEWTGLAQFRAFLVDRLTGTNLPSAR